MAWAEGIRESCGPNFHLVLDPNTRFDRPAEVLRFSRGLEAAGKTFAYYSIEAAAGKIAGI